MRLSGILYACVSRGPVILADYLNSGVQGNASVVALQILEKSLGRRVPFAFLDDIRTRFSATHGAAAPTAAAYSLGEAFSSVLRDRALYHSNPMSDPITRVTGQVSGLRDIMVDNIQQVLERGERLELLVQRTDDFAENAFVFKRGATAMKRAYQWRNVGMAFCVVLLILLGVYVLAALLCGPGLNHC